MLLGLSDVSLSGPILATARCPPIPAENATSHKRRLLMLQDNTWLENNKGPRV